MRILISLYSFFLTLIQFDRRVFTDEQEWDLFEHVDIEITQQIDEYLDNGHNHSMVICSSHAARLI